jgi:hypothetical protein
VPELPPPHARPRYATSAPRRRRSAREPR